MGHHHRLLRLDPDRLGPPLSAHLAVASLLVGLAWGPAPDAIGADVLATNPTPEAQPGGSAAAGRLVLVHRVLAQDQGDWQVDYGFKNAGAEPIALLPRDIAARANASATLGSCVESLCATGRVAAR